MNAFAGARRAARSSWLEWFARAGLVARALVYALVAALAARVAIDARAADDAHIDRRGALELAASDPLGRAAVVVLAVAFAGYALWRLGLAAFPRSEKKLIRRVRHLGVGLLYLGVFVIGMRYVVGTSGEDRVREADVTAAVMRMPAGRWIVAATGLGFLGYAGWSVYRAVSGRSRRNLRTETMSGGAERWAVIVAGAGLASKAVAHSVVGTFLLRAAWMHDPTLAVGLDGALRAIGGTDWGGAMLGVLAAGLFARGVFSVFEARYRRAV